MSVIDRATQIKLEEYADPPAAPLWTNNVPFCVPRCPHHDGKRCDIIGIRAPAICEPMVGQMGAALADAGPQDRPASPTVGWAPRSQAAQPFDERSRTIEDCVNAICQDCREGRTSFRIADRWVHLNGAQPQTAEKPCPAHALHLLAEQHHGLSSLGAGQE